MVLARRTTLSTNTAQASPQICHDFINLPPCPLLPRPSSRERTRRDRFTAIWFVFPAMEEKPRTAARGENSSPGSQPLLTRMESGNLSVINTPLLRHLNHRVLPIQRALKREALATGEPVATHQLPLRRWLCHLSARALELINRKRKNRGVYALPL